jgi:hypothetical protein
MSDVEYRLEGTNWLAFTFWDGIMVEAETNPGSSK